MLNDARGQAEAMLELRYALPTGSPLPELTGGKYIRLPYQVITADNVLEFVADSAHVEGGP